METDTHFWICLEGILEKIKGERPTQIDRGPHRMVWNHHMGLRVDRAIEGKGGREKNMRTHIAAPEPIRW